MKTILDHIWASFDPTTRVERQERYRDRHVPFDTQSLSQKRGWLRAGNSYTGYYRTKYGAWRGKIVQRGKKFDVYIFEAPTEQLQRHSRWICFYLFARGARNDYQINLALNPKDRKVDSIIFYVERIIIESFEQAAARGDDYASLY